MHVNMTTHQLGWGLAIILLLASGCASAPPPKSLAAGDLKDIVGLWTGRFDSSGLARQHVVTIREDGTFQETATGAVDSSGSVQIRNGLVVFTGSQTKGELQLHASGTERVLIGQGEVLQGFIRSYTGLSGGRYAIRLTPAR